MPEYEVYLCHHGVKGMKWGVRRTAAQLGRLVKKGAKKAKSAYDSHREKKKAEKAAEERVRKEKAIRKKPLSKLSETELKERVSRLKLEKEIADLEKQIGEARGTGKSKTSKFMSVVGKEVIKPALIKVARDQLGNYLNGIAGNVVKKGVNDFTDNFNKKHNQNNNKNNQNNNKNNQNNNKNNQNNNKNNQNNNEKPKTEKPKTEKPKKDDRIVFEGEVVGEGTSRYNPGRSKKKKNNRAKSAPIKAEGWVHDSVSRATSSTAMIVRGDDYIRRLLN